MGAEQARAAALKRGASPESAEALTWDRKIAELHLSELEKTISHLKIPDEPSQGGDEERRRQALLRECAAAERRMVDVLARARRAAKSRQEDAASLTLTLTSNPNL